MNTGLKALSLAFALGITAGYSPKCLAGTYSNAIINTPGLVGYWQLGETSGNYADSSTQGNVGVPGGDITQGVPGARPSDGFLGFDANHNAASFDSEDYGFPGANEFDDPYDYVDVANPSSGVLDPGLSNYTVSLWFKVASDGNLYTLISKGTGGHDGWLFERLDPNEGMYSNLLNINMVPGSSGGNGRGPVAYVTQPEWTNLVVVLHRNGDATPGYSDSGVSMFIDGQFIAEDSTTLFDGVNTTSTADLEIGAFRSYGIEAYTGLMSDVAIFKSALTPSQISNLYNAAVTGTFSAGPLSWTNVGGSGDGVTWDTTSQNWYSGGSTTYSDNSDVVFNDSNNGNYAVTLNMTVSPKSVTVNNSSGDYTISGSGTITGNGSLTKEGTGKLTLLTSNTYSGGTHVLGGVLVVGQAHALPTNGQLTVGNGTDAATVQLAPGIGEVEISGLTVNGGAVLDLTDNAVLVDYTGSSPVLSIRADLVSGYNNGLWNGNGINSSTAAANAEASTTLGYADSGSKILIKYTWVGDANLDGVVNETDLLAMSPSGSTWAEGDFNYDGQVNADDYSLLLLGVAYGGTTNISMMVPEPGMCLPILLSMAALSRRKSWRSVSAQTEGSND
ncbi:MAG TPA: LamG-like jellyroll fold domain-containing protein [Tepidisphaeraceae bacterium]|nr:LamG-like jellyroll fold domain-containing protein [Tepidisphaeraceae bacterium]